jgi:hypothetical protein
MVHFVETIATHTIDDDLLAFQEALNKSVVWSVCRYDAYVVQ